MQVQQEVQPVHSYSEAWESLATLISFLLNLMHAYSYVSTCICHASVVWSPHTYELKWSSVKVPILSLMISQATCYLYSYSVSSMHMINW